MITIEDMIGKRFNRWVVLSFSHKDEWNQQFYFCRCDCGIEKLVEKRNMVNNLSKSCGCLKKEIQRDLRTKHGMFKTKEYRAWRSMQDRCYNKKTKQYHNYGGRGIEVCKEWIGNFEQFYKDMGKSPENTSLDRIDNNGNYSKENCRWATIKEQANNRATNTKITINGETKNIKEWAQIIGVSCTCLAYRVKTGRTEDELLLKKVVPKYAKIKHKKNNRIITLKGETKTLTEWADTLGIAKSTMHHRMTYGWTEEEILRPKLQ
jgi:hypothetical protein